MPSAETSGILVPVNCKISMCCDSMKAARKLLNSNVNRSSKYVSIFLQIEREYIVARPTKLGKQWANHFILVLIATPLCAMSLPQCHLLRFSFITASTFPFQGFAFRPGHPDDLSFHLTLDFHHGLRRPR